MILHFFWLFFLLGMWSCYDGCKSASFASEKSLQRHQNTCRFAKEGFANAIAASKRKLAAEKEETAAKALANQHAEEERRRLREAEAEASFLPASVHDSDRLQVSMNITCSANFSL